MINELIKYELDYIEMLAPGSTKLVRLEELNNYENVLNLYSYLDLEIPSEADIQAVMENDNDEVRHSHHKRLDLLKIPRITKKDIEIIQNRTKNHLEEYGYSG